MPRYAKFLKELSKNKRKVKDKDHVVVSKNVSGLPKKTMPEKCCNPGMFTVPCVIGDKMM